MKQKFLLMIGVCATMLTSCSNDDHNVIAVIDGTEGNAVITVFGSLTNNSRAVDTSWDNGDQIGLTSANMISNKPYVTADGDGVFKAVGETDYYNDADTHTFTAYYPYSADVAEDGTFEFTSSDVATIEGQKNNDFLWAEGNGSAKIPGINMTFAHEMTRVIINVTTDTDAGFYDDDIFANVDESSIKSSTGILDAAYVTGKFNTLTGKVTRTNARNQFTMTGSDDADNHVRQYLMILPEQESCNYKHIFNKDLSNEQVFTAQLESMTWKAGYTYTYNIVIGRNGAYVAKSTIEQWIDGGESNSNCSPA